MTGESNLIAAIDIGTTKIVAVVGRKMQDGKIELLGMESVPSTGVKRGVVLNIEETVSAIQNVRTKVEQHLNIKLEKVYVGIAGQHIRSLQNKVSRYITGSSEITQADIDQLYHDNFNMLIDAGEKIMHVIPQDYKVDHETGVKQPVGMSGRHIEGNFHIVLGRIASVNNIQKCIKRVNLELQGMILEPLASSHSVLTDDEKEAGVVLVDIGGGTTDVAVFYDGIIRHTAVIPFGGNVITSDIKEGCSILYKQAEALKVQFGGAIGEREREDMVFAIPALNEGWEAKEISAKSLAYIIQARMEEIIDLVSIQIEKSGYYHKLGAGIVVTGGGALLKNISDLIKLRTALDVRVGLPDRLLDGNIPEKAHMPMYSTSIGLLLSAMHKQTSSIGEPELFPDVEPKTNAKEAKEATSRSRRSSKKKKKKKDPDSGMGNLFEGVLDGIQNGLASIFDDRDSDM